VHVTDDLETGGTWEYVEHAFAAPGAELMSVWRRDGKKFTKKSDCVTKYVRDDLKEFMDERISKEESPHDKKLGIYKGEDSCVPEPTEHK